MALYGSAFPVDVKPGDKPVVVTVICPNEYAHQRLMQALNNIVPEAGDATVYDPSYVHHDAVMAQHEGPVAAALRELAEANDDDLGAPDEPPRCKTGNCE